MDTNELEHRRKLWEQGFWEIPGGLDTGEFNFDWRPNPHDRPYIHQFGTQWQMTGGPRFVVPEYQGVKYRDEQTAKMLPNQKNFKVLTDLQVSFDYSWHPDENEPPFIWVFGGQHYSSAEFPILEYHVNGATDRKYITEPVATILPYDKNLKILVEGATIDQSWHPSPHEPPYIYVWGNKWNSAEVESTIEYHVPGATDRKYMNNMIATLSVMEDNWRILIEGASIDQTWRPNPHEPPYIYVWGNKWNSAEVEPTIEYHVPGATDRKYITDMIADLSSVGKNWHILVENASIDQTWRPNPYDPPYIYVWGNKWNSAEVEPTIEYHIPGATNRKYITDMIADLSPVGKNWHILIEGASIDQTWRPNPYDPPYIYIWGNKWNDANTEPTIAYHIPGATDRKFMTDSVANLAPNMNNWTVSNTEDYQTFDFTWRPNPFSPPQIYQWENNGPVYTVPGATEMVFMTREKSYEVHDNVSRYYVTTTLEDLIEQHPTEVFWALNGDLNYDKFDFNWQPTSDKLNYVNVFGTALSKDVATYYINGPIWSKGFRELNYIDYELDVVTDLDMYYINRGNNSDQFDQLKLQFPRLQKTRYAGSWIDTINRCIKKSTTKLIWILSSEVDYSEFKFDFYPSSWQRNMIHVFGTQWSHWGNTYLINTETFETDTKYLQQIEHAKSINFVRRRRAKISQCLHDIVYIDFGNESDSLYQLQDKCDGHDVTVLEYQNSYVETLTNWINKKSEYEIKQEHNVWVCSSLCDYQNFDFTWVGDPFQSDQIHVFSSKFDNTRQKFGDTFFINLVEFKKESEYLTSLEDYSKSVNYIGHLSVDRLKHPVIEHDYDSQADAIKNIQTRNWPYYELINLSSSPEKNQSVIPNMWNQEDYQVIVTSSGSSRIFAPDTAIDIISSEVYEYPNIKITNELDQSQPLDIIFFSNGEPSADDNYQELLSIVKERKLSNRVIRSSDVVGRVASQHAAADASNTAWYFLVNGKLRVNPEFDFSWQPDRLQRAKHYIFMATNPVNHLEYGHQAIVANNKQLTLATETRGLDFTMDSPHEVINMNCGTAVYNTDSWTAWRTAFRECIKLKYYSVINNDQQNLDRLNTWLRVGHGENGQWSTGGAYDAIEYYESVNGELSELMKSYDWAMLKELYDSKYG
jgi:hypothetical protein